MVKHTAIISIGEETILCEKGGIETSFLTSVYREKNIPMIALQI